MKISGYWKNYSDFSGLASDVARTLSLSAIALVWVFKLETPAGFKLPKELLVPTAMVVFSLLLDFIQYLYLALVWRIYARSLEKAHPNSEEEFEHEPWIPLVGEIIFTLKCLFLLVAYFLLGEYLWSRIF